MFLIGFLSCMSLATIYSGKEIPFNFSGNGNLNAPGDWIKKNQIHIYKDKVIIDVDDPSLGRYAPTGSMIPVLDKNSNGIKIIPKKEEDINIGDIITFEQDGMLIVHRVVEKGEDEEGVYFITKGDNNNITDGKIRFKDIKYVTIAIIY